MAWSGSLVQDADDPLGTKKRAAGNLTEARDAATAHNNGLPLRAPRALALRFAPGHAYGTSATLKRYLGCGAAPLRNGGPVITDCPFCGIAAGEVPAVVVYQDSDILAFLDRSPVRPGHTQIIPNQHFDYFDDLPSALGSKILSLGQILAQRLKEVYGVQRVGFLFTGGDVPHAHAHVIPVHEGTDVTSARYIVSPDGLEWSSAHLRTERTTLLQVKEALGELSDQHAR